MQCLSGCCNQIMKKIHCTLPHLKTEKKKKNPSKELGWYGCTLKRTTMISQFNCICTVCYSSCSGETRSERFWFSKVTHCSGCLKILQISSVRHIEKSEFSSHFQTVKPASCPLQTACTLKTWKLKTFHRITERTRLEGTSEIIQSNSLPCRII